MSDLPADWHDRLDLREQIARIDRTQAELAKLNAETQKLLAEAPKFAAEARKFRWDPILVIAGAIVAGVFLRLPEILHAMGH